MTNKAIGPEWEKVEKELFTPQEIQESKSKADFICSFIQARKKAGYTQKNLACLSGVKQPAIARIETDASNPTLDTLFKLLSAMGMTLAIVPAEKAK